MLNDDKIVGIVEIAKWIAKKKGANMAKINKDALEIARSKVGLSEEGKNQGPIVEWAMKPWSKVKPDQTGWAEWCAAFVCTCYYHAGSLIIRKYGTTNVKTLWTKMNKLGLAWEHYNTGRLPEPGDLLFYSGLGHVGMVESCDAEYVYTIEGNADNQVKRQMLLLTGHRIYGFARING